MLVEASSSIQVLGNFQEFDILEVVVLILTDSDIVPCIEE